MVQKIIFFKAIFEAKFKIFQGTGPPSPLDRWDRDRWLARVLLPQAQGLVRIFECLIFFKQDSNIGGGQHRAEPVKKRFFLKNIEM